MMMAKKRITQIGRERGRRRVQTRHHCRSASDEMMMVGNESIAAADTKSRKYNTKLIQYFPLILFVLRGPGSSVAVQRLRRRQY